ncbi:luciferin sulfotransferase-like [Cherax quadricarinatus]|uniref:luciferin sulfotransferase-like n=1 Tax=Cherax quadricarinatus TaxID=27406 RepID=UPI00387EBD7E
MGSLDTWVLRNHMTVDTGRPTDSRRTARDKPSLLEAKARIPKFPIGHTRSSAFHPPLFDCFLPPDFDTTGMSEDDPKIPGNTWRILQDLASPRTIKSHLTKELLPKQIWQTKPKVVYVCRDPRDVCVSYYYHDVKFQALTATFDQFVPLFLHNLLFFSPIWPHILGFWKVRNKDHILFLRYEDMKENLAAVVRQTAGFLGKEVDEEKVSWLVHHCSFGEMSKNSAANNETMMIRSTEEAKNIKFMRKGQVTRVR